VRCFVVFEDPSSWAADDPLLYRSSDASGLSLRSMTRAGKAPESLPPRSIGPRRSGLYGSIHSVPRPQACRVAGRCPGSARRLTFLGWPVFTPSHQA
jgi:hypothetical protein